MSWFVYNSNGKLLQSLVVSDNAVTNAKMADDAIGVAELSASGTASSSTFLRGDNAWAAPAGGPSQANQTALEAETNEDTYAPPDQMKHHPGVAKARIQIPSNGVVTPSAANSNNIASVTDTGTGNRSIVIATDFSNTTWAALGSSGDNSQFTTALQDYAAGSITLQAYQAGTLTDCRQAFAGFGDQ